MPMDYKTSVSVTTNNPIDGSHNSSSVTTVNNYNSNSVLYNDVSSRIHSSVAATNNMNNLQQNINTNAMNAGVLNNSNNNNNSSNNSLIGGIRRSTTYDQMSSTERGVPGQGTSVLSTSKSFQNNDELQIDNEQLIEKLFPKCRVKSAQNNNNNNNNNNKLLMKDSHSVGGKKYSKNGYIKKLSKNRYSGSSFTSSSIPTSDGSSSSEEEIFSATVLQKQQYKHQFASHHSHLQQQQQPHQQPQNRGNFQQDTSTFRSQQQQPPPTNGNNRHSLPVRKNCNAASAPSRRVWNFMDISASPSPPSMSPSFESSTDIYSSSHLAGGSVDTSGQYCINDDEIRLPSQTQHDASESPYIARDKSCPETSKQQKTTTVATIKHGDAHFRLDSLLMGPEVKSNSELTKRRIDNGLVQQRTNDYYNNNNNNNTIDSESYSGKEYKDDKFELQSRRSRIEIAGGREIYSQNRCSKAKRRSKQTSSHQNYQESTYHQAQLPSLPSETEVTPVSFVASSESPPPPAEPVQEYYACQEENNDLQDCHSDFDEEELLRQRQRIAELLEECKNLAAARMGDKLDSLPEVPEIPEHESAEGNVVCDVNDDVVEDLREDYRDDNDGLHDGEDDRDADQDNQTAPASAAALDSTFNAVDDARETMPLKQKDDEHDEECLECQDERRGHEFSSIAITEYEESPKRYGPKPGYPKRIDNNNAGTCCLLETETACHRFTKNDPLPPESCCSPHSSGSSSASVSSRSGSYTSSDLRSSSISSCHSAPIGSSSLLDHHHHWPSNSQSRDKIRPDKSRSVVDTHRRDGAPDNDELMKAILGVPPRPVHDSEPEAEEQDEEDMTSSSDLKPHYEPGLGQDTSTVGTSSLASETNESKTFKSSGYSSERSIVAATGPTSGPTSVSMQSSSSSSVMATAAANNTGLNRQPVRFEDCQVPVSNAGAGSSPANQPEMSDLVRRDSLSSRKVGLSEPLQKVISSSVSASVAGTSSPSSSGALSQKVKHPSQTSTVIPKGHSSTSPSLWNSTSQPSLESSEGSFRSSKFVEQFSPEPSRRESMPDSSNTNPGIAGLNENGNESLSIGGKSSTVSGGAAMPVLEDGLSSGVPSSDDDYDDEDDDCAEDEDDEAMLHGARNLGARHSSGQSAGSGDVERYVNEYRRDNYYSALSANNSGENRIRKTGVFYPPGTQPTHGHHHHDHHHHVHSSLIQDSNQQTQQALQQQQPQQQSSRNTIKSIGQVSSSLGSEVQSQQNYSTLQTSNQQQQQQASTNYQSQLSQQAKAHSQQIQSQQQQQQLNTSNVPSQQQPSSYHHHYYNTPEGQNRQQNTVVGRSPTSGQASVPNSGQLHTHYHQHHGSQRGSPQPIAEQQRQQQQTPQSQLEMTGSNGIPHDNDCDTDQETDRLLGAQRTAQVNNDERQTYYDEKNSTKRSQSTSREVLIEGVLFRARYLGSTQLACDGQPTKATRMVQAEEAVSRIKAPEGETQPSTEVDLFISTEKIMVLNTDLKEIMMDHALRTISYIADIGDLLVLMARRRNLEDSNDVKKLPKMICHVFESEEAQYIAQSIGQAFQVAYMEFLKANGIEDNSYLKEMDYQEVLNSQEIFGNELEMFAKRERQKEVIVPKQKGEILGLVIVESGWGSMLPTVVIANLLQNSPSARCGQLNIGDQIIAINGISLVGLPLSTCQTYVRNTKNLTVVKFTIVPCAPVVEVKIKRPDTKYQLGFSVQNGVICSLLRGGIAERGGVRVGHRIIEINGQSVVAVPHDRIVNLLATSVGEIHMKTMPTSMFRLLTGQDVPSFM